MRSFYKFNVNELFAAGGILRRVFMNEMFCSKHESLIVTPPHILRAAFRRGL